MNRIAFLGSVNSRRKVKRPAENVNPFQVESEELGQAPTQDDGQSKVHPIVITPAHEACYPQSQEKAIAVEASTPTTEPGATLAIIAGGAGRRMGGPKYALKMNGKSILSVMLDQLCWQGRTMLVVQDGGKTVDGQERVDRILADTIPGQGPLRGIVTALDCCDTKSLIAVPIDMPGLRSAHLMWILEQGLKSQAQRLLLRRMVCGHAVIEPFPAFFRMCGTAPIRNLLDRGRRALRELADLPDTCVIGAPTSWGEQVWTNMNTPAEASAVGARLVTRRVDSAEGI